MVDRIPAPRVRQLGMTLIEMMVAITIGLLIVGGLTYIFLNSSRAQRELQKSGQQLDSGTYALGVLIDDLHHAGYYGDLFQLPAASATLPSPCSLSATDIYDALAFPVQGYNNSAPSGCLSSAAAYKTGTDVLVIRRGQTEALGASDVPVVGDIYLQAAGKTAEIQTGATTGYSYGTTKADGSATTLTKKNGSAADIRKFNVHIYFVSNCSQTDCSVNSDGIPTLKRLELYSAGSAASFRIVPIAEGIENLQVDYGLDTDTTPVNGMTNQVGDGVPDTYVDDPAVVPVVAPTLNQWSNVTAVNLYVLARTFESTAGYTDDKTYDLGVGSASLGVGATKPGGSFKRNVFHGVARISNQAMRREF